jgi:hypothetical protein
MTTPTIALVLLESSDVSATVVGTTAPVSVGNDRSLGRAFLFFRCRRQVGRRRRALGDLDRRRRILRFRRAFCGDLDPGDLTDVACLDDGEVDVTGRCRRL